MDALWEINNYFAQRNIGIRVSRSGEPLRNGIFTSYPVWIQGQDYEITRRFWEEGGSVSYNNIIIYDGQTMTVYLTR
jgi:hypothetical protein